ncbi:hypothetical protein IKF02_03295 [Candidatus Saccharibacteria bacterium]|nr:hypothetical protein [Candidatus Saccharibacteria bacterium]
MVKGDGVNRKQPRERGVLIGVLSSLAVLIVMLVVAVVAININGDMERGGNLSEYENELNEELLKARQKDIDDIISVYQIYIDKLNEEDAAKLMDQRAEEIDLLDTERKYGETVISDLISVDKMYPTAESAIDVLNMALSYGFSEIADDYSNILVERAGNNFSDGETEG